MFSVNECRDATLFLDFSNNVLSKRCLATCLRAVYFDDTSSRNTFDSKRDIKRYRPCRYYVYIACLRLAKSHDGVVAVLLFYLFYSSLGRLNFWIFFFWHIFLSLILRWIRGLIFV